MLCYIPTGSGLRLQQASQSGNAILFATPTAGPAALLVGLKDCGEDCAIFASTTPGATVVGSFPGLAYIRASKPLTKFAGLVPPAPGPGSSGHAFLVENDQYCWVYREPGAGAVQGTQQLIPLPAGATVIGVHPAGPGVLAILTEAALIAVHLR